jgi:hypothetical protein
MLFHIYMLVQYFSVTILGLMTLIKPTIGAALQRRGWDSDNQVNYYSDERCKKYAGSWGGPIRMYQNEDINIGGEFIGSIILLPGSRQNFDFLDADGQQIATDSGMCPFSGAAPILIDSNGNSCYVIGKNVNTITLYSQVRAVIPSK